MDRLPRVYVQVTTDTGLDLDFTLDQSTILTSHVWKVRGFIDMARAYLREYGTLLDEYIRMDSETLVREMRQEAKRKGATNE